MCLVNLPHPNIFLNRHVKRIKPCVFRGEGARQTAAGMHRRTEVIIPKLDLKVTVRIASCLAFRSHLRPDDVGRALANSEVYQSF